MALDQAGGQSLFSLLKNDLCLMFYQLRVFWLNLWLKNKSRLYVPTACAKTFHTDVKFHEVAINLSVEELQSNNTVINNHLINFSWSHDSGMMNSYRGWR